MSNLKEDFIQNERFKESNISKMGNSLQAILFRINLIKEGKEFQSDPRTKSNLERLENDALKLKDVILEMKEENQKLMFAEVN